MVETVKHKQEEWVIDHLTFSFCQAKPKPKPNHGGAVLVLPNISNKPLGKTAEDGTLGQAYKPKLLVCMDIPQNSF